MIDIVSQDKVGSPPVREAWIETVEDAHSGMIGVGRLPCGRRGLKHYG